MCTLPLWNLVWVRRQDRYTWFNRERYKMEYNWISFRKIDRKDSENPKAGEIDMGRKEGLQTRKDLRCSLKDKQGAWGKRSIGEIEPKESYTKKVKNLLSSLLLMIDVYPWPVWGVSKGHFPYNQVKPGFLLEGNLEKRCMKSQSVMLIEQQLRLRPSAI